MMHEGMDSQRGEGHSQYQRQCQGEQPAAQHHLMQHLMVGGQAAYEGDASTCYLALVAVTMP
jgi:hypothetical protein